MNDEYLAYGSQPHVAPGLRILESEQLEDLNVEGDLDQKQSLTPFCDILYDSHATKRLLTLTVLP